MGYSFEPLPPPPPLSGQDADELDDERRRVRNRTAALLLMVPFSFPAWFRLRRQDPDLARRLRPALAANITQDLLIVAMAVFLIWFTGNRDAIIEVLSDRLSDWILEQGGF